jgi:hypothetical protein
LVLAAFYAFLNLNLSQEFLKKSFFARKTGRDFASPSRIDNHPRLPPSKSKPAVGSVLPCYIPSAATPSHRAGVTHSTAVITFN